VTTYIIQNKTNPRLFWNKETNEWGNRYHCSKYPPLERLKANIPLDGIFINAELRLEEAYTPPEESPRAKRYNKVNRSEILKHR